ncbi:SDR family oxidoreductase, partial [Streptomyces griseoluteus]|uniref:SDR family oxidoreductase n=1 Tax=Streptomyces griseoluteus TaxID=29306 RepID=UPI0036BA7435
MNDSPVALITGGGSGIGAAVARQLLEAGTRVTVTGRGKDRLGEFAESVGDPGELLVVPGSASSYDDVRDAVDRTLERYGRLDTVIANDVRSDSPTEPTRRGPAPRRLAPPRGPGWGATPPPAPR